MFPFGVLAILAVGLAVAGGGGGDDDDIINEDVVDTPEEDEPVETANPDEEALALVAADREDGAEISSEDLVSQGPEFGEDADRDYIVRPNQTDVSDIEIGYDANIGFRLDLVDDIQTVTVGLNTNVEAPHADVEVVNDSSVQPDGSPLTETFITPIYPSGTNITFEVSAEQIGAHVAQIDLSNPDDVLNFQFADDVAGNLHLITEETTTGDNTDEMTAERVMYLIFTPADISGLTESETLAIMEGDTENAPAGSELVAEIFLGEESVSQEFNEIVIRDFMNENAVVNTNLDWTSQQVQEPDPVTPGTTGGGTTGGGTTGGGTSGGGTSGGGTVVVDGGGATGGGETPTVPTTNPLITDLLNDPTIAPDLNLDDLTPEELQELSDILDGLDDITGIPTLPGLTPVIF